MSFLCRGFLDVWQKRFWVRNFGGISQFLRCKARFSDAELFNGLFELTNNVKGRTTYLHLRIVQFETQYVKCLTTCASRMRMQFRQAYRFVPEASLSV